jgi:hypothetical protein
METMRKLECSSINIKVVLKNSQRPYGNNQDAPQQMNGLRKCIYIQWNFIQPQRRMKFCHLQVNG